MNIENLSQEELQTLHTLLGKALEQPKPKVHLDPVNQMVDEIMEEFNFNRLQLAMVALDWKWASAKNGIPTTDELREEAERLLRRAAELRLGSSFKDAHHDVPVITGSGGFEAKAWCNESKTKINGLELAFILEHWGAEVR